MSHTKSFVGTGSIPDTYLHFVIHLDGETAQFTLSKGFEQQTLLHDARALTFEHMAHSKIMPASEWFTAPVELISEKTRRKIDHFEDLLVAVLQDKHFAKLPLSLQDQIKEALD